MRSIPTDWTPSVTTEADSGDNTVIAAPAAGYALEIKKFLVQNESSTDTTVLIKVGSTSYYRALLTQYGSISETFDLGDGDVWRLTAATAFIVNLSAANSHGVTVWYRTVKV